MSKKKRVAIMSLGDGGGSQVVSLAEWVRVNAPKALHEISFVLANTNQVSLREHFHVLKEVVEEPTALLVGPKTTRSQGTGSVVSVGHNAMLESIANGAVAEHFFRHPAEAVFTFSSWGDGATGLGGLYPLVKFLREQMKVVVIPSITYGSIEKSGISPERQVELAKQLDAFDSEGIPLILALMDTIDSDLSRKLAYKRMDQIVARSMGGIVNVFTKPLRFDHNDWLTHVYANPGGGKKRLLPGGVILPHVSAKDPELLLQAAQQLFNNRHFDFDRSNVGGGLLVLEHGGLSMKVETDFVNALSLLIQKEHERKHPDTASPYHAKPVFEEGSPEQDLKVDMLLSQFTGINPAMLPVIKWFSDDDPYEVRGEEVIVSSVEAEDLGTSAHTEVVVTEDPSFNTAEALDLHQAETPIVTPEPVPPVPAETVPAPAPKPAPASYRSFLELVEAAEKRGVATAAAILQEGNPYSLTLSDGTSFGEVLQFPLEGEQWAEEILRALISLLRFASKLKVHDTSSVPFSNEWRTLMEQGLRLKKGLLPRTANGVIVNYQGNIQVVNQTIRSQTLPENVKFAIDAGCRIFQLFGNDLVLHLLAAEDTSVAASFRRRVDGFKTNFQT